MSFWNLMVVSLVTSGGGTVRLALGLFFREK